MGLRLKLANALFSLIVVSLTTNAMAQATDYFARFKYTKQEAIALLKSADGQSLQNAPAARELLDDMGYWKTVRAQGAFQLTPELELQVSAQMDYLAKAFTYEAGDLVWLKAETPDEKPYGLAQVNHRAIIRDHMKSGGTDLYLVEMYVDGADQMTRRPGTLYDGRQGQILYYKDNYVLSSKMKVFTKSELDALNSPASSLEKDNVGEILDWNGDGVWQEKLESFKSKMAAAGFQIDWTASPEKIYAQQSQLLLEIFKHFKMNRNAPSNNGRGIGLRSCGGGICFDQALVLSFAIQALGQTSGLKAFNLNGTTVNPEGGHGFVRVDIKTKPQDVIFERVIGYDDFISNRQTIMAGGDDIYALEDPMAKLASRTSKLVFNGVSVHTTTRTLISDPGWADYGKTPDQFARMHVTIALNPLPVDANRAVHGLSSQRPLVEVAAQIGAKGPLAVQSTQAVKTLDAASRESLKSLFAGKGGQCSAMFGGV